MYKNTAKHPSDRSKNSVFLNSNHCQRMKQIQNRCPKLTAPASTAAMYLLAANPNIYARAEPCFYEKTLAFDKAVLTGISPHNYTLLSAARDIYTDASRVTLSDLSNKAVVDQRAFFLIKNALLIARESNIKGENL